MNNNRLLEKLGEITHTFRKAKALSQTEVGLRSATSQMTIQRLESGSGSGTSIDALLRIAQVLEISLGDVFLELEKGYDHTGILSRRTEWENLIEKLNTLPAESKKWLSEMILKALEHPRY